MIVFVMSSEYYVDHERGLEQKLFQSCMGVKYGNQCERPLFCSFSACCLTLCSDCGGAFPQSAGVTSGYEETLLLLPGGKGK